MEHFAASFFSSPNRLCRHKFCFPFPTLCNPAAVKKTLVASQLSHSPQPTLTHATKMARLASFLAILALTAGSAFAGE